MLHKNRQGAAAILAMIFVAVFGLLSVAFHTMTAAAISTAANDKGAAAAQGAADSGFEYTRFLLSRPVNQFASTSEPATSSEINAIYTSLATTYGVSCSFDGVTLRIPAATGTISLFPSQPSEKGDFFATIVAHADAATPHKLKVTVTGSNGITANNIARTVVASCIPADTLTSVSSPLDFGVAAAGTVQFKNNVYVQTQDIGATDVTDSTMLSASSAATSVIATSSSNVDSIIGTIWVTESPTQVSSNVTSPQTTVKVLTNPPYFDDYALPESTYTGDPTFAVYNTYAAFTADTGRTKTKVYIKGPSSITINGSYGRTINASMVFGPAVKTIDVQGSKQVPTLISADTQYKYAIIAPAAHITYNGNTAAEFRGYVIADRFSGNNNNSSRFTIRDGGLITLDPSASSCDLGQSDLYIFLPTKEKRPYSTHNLKYRRYIMDYSDYQEL